MIFNNENKMLEDSQKNVELKVFGFRTFVRSPLKS